MCGLLNPYEGSVWLCAGELEMYTCLPLIPATHNHVAWNLTTMHAYMCIQDYYTVVSTMATLPPCMVVT